MKKAQMSINTIIMVIIALVVLAAVILFFTGQFSKSSAELDKYGPDETASSAGCQLACNMEKAGAGTPYSKKVCATECPPSGCEGIPLTDCPKEDLLESVGGKDNDGVPTTIDCDDNDAGNQKMKPNCD